MATKIGIIGKGNVGSALQRGLAKAGHEVRVAGKEPGLAQKTAAWADVVFLAVPFGALDATIGELGSAADGKPVVDVTNPLTADFKPALGFQSSAAEDLQKKAPRAKIVKAFNTIFAKHMDNGQVKGEKISVLTAGDDAAAKATVMGLAKDIGFDPIDAGGLPAARLLEAAGYLAISLGYVQKMGQDIAIRVVH